jgi:hypothetical protein
MPKAPKIPTGLQDKITQKIKGLNTIPKIQKETVRLIARHFIRQKYPERLKEFDALYETTYNTVTKIPQVTRRLAATKGTPNLKYLSQRPDLLNSVVLITYLFVTKLSKARDELNKNRSLILNAVTHEILKNGFNPQWINGIGNLVDKLLLK